MPAPSLANVTVGVEAGPDLGGESVREGLPEDRHTVQRDPEEVAGRERTRSIERIDRREQEGQVHGGMRPEIRQRDGHHVPRLASQQVAAELVAGRTQPGEALDRGSPRRAGRDRRRQRALELVTLPAALVPMRSNVAPLSASVAPPIT
jgi:hypothetical protein